MTTKTKLPTAPGRDEQGRFLPGCRPTGAARTYGDDVYHRIFERMAGGESLWAICEDDDMPSESAVRKAAVMNPDTLGSKYMRARQLQQEARVENGFKLTKAAMEGNWTKEQVAALGHHLRHVEWAASRLHPNQFAERAQHILSGPGGEALEVSVTIDEPAKRNGES